MAVANYAKQAKQAFFKMASLDSEIKNKALSNMVKNLKSHSMKIIEENKKDMERSRQQGIATPLIKRLKFDEEKIKEVCRGLEDLISFDDPVGHTIEAKELDESFELYKVACPIGVIGVIFESRPDALVQISSLCLKSGNSVLLKGGSEALLTNRILADIILESSLEAGVPQGWLGLLETREDVKDMLSQDEYLNLIIPRGSNEFVKYIMDNTRVPVLGHADGICHLYVDEKADLKKAVSIAIDSKTQYVAVCNALETLLVHQDVAKEFLPELKIKLDEKNTEIRGCEKCCKIIDAKPATEDDWKTEYLDYILSIKVVSSMDEAIAHINKYGSGHTDSIVTENAGTADQFMNQVDAASVLWNCSTRFSDGYRFGLGAEVGISTNKIHARGPVGMEGLLIYKWKLVGKGQIVEDYSSGKKSFKHKRINKNFKI